MKNQRKISLLLLCTTALMFAPTQTADAFWKGVGKWSGPGPFWGIDVVYPITFGPLPTIPDDFLENENNLRLLDRYFVPGVLVIDAVKFLKDDEEMKDLGEKYGVPAFSPPSWRDGLNDAQILEAFVDAMQVAARDPTTGASKLAPLDPTVADSWLARTTNPGLLRDALERMGPFNRFRFPGLSKIPGLFTSQQIQRLQKGNDTIDLAGQLLTISFGGAWSYKNDLPYGDYSGSRSVRWLTLYPAYERRFCPCSKTTAPDAALPDAGTRPQHQNNVFWNVGPAVHFFDGDAFDSFRKVSVRSRIGYSFGWGKVGLGVGFEGDYFFGAVEHTKFGALDNGTHQWGWGFFMHIEVPGFTL